MTMDEEAASAAAEDRIAEWKTRRPRPSGTANGGGGAVYGLGMIGALAYFVGAARSRQDYLLAVPMAVVWPALLVYRLLKQANG